VHGNFLGGINPIIPLVCAPVGRVIVMIRVRFIFSGANLRKTRGGVADPGRR